MANDQNWYTTVFKTWQVKQLGRKPTADELASIHKLGARPGKQALANAMALRECGVTGAQIVIACGAPQLNKMRGFIADALLKRLPTAQSAEGHTVYKLEVTPKGKQRIARNEQSASKLEAAGKLEAAAEKTAEVRPSKAVRKAVKKAVKGKAKLEKAASEAVKADATATAMVANHTATEADTAQPAADENQQA